jgi:hypothetical protein
VCEGTRHNFMASTVTATAPSQAAPTEAAAEEEEEASAAEAGAAGTRPRRYSLGGQPQGATGPIRSASTGAIRTPAQTRRVSQQIHGDPGLLGDPRLGAARGLRQSLSGTGGSGSDTVWAWQARRGASRPGSRGSQRSNADETTSRPGSRPGSRAGSRPGTRGGDSSGGGVGRVLSAGGIPPALPIGLHDVRDEYYEGDELLLHEDILHFSNPRLFPLNPGSGKTFPLPSLNFTFNTC